MGNEERSAVIMLGGKEYELLLTTKATKEIARRYGGLQNLGEKLMKSENFEEALDEITWLLALLINQPILIHNLQHPDETRPLLTVEEIELLTAPADLSGYRDAITAAMYRGTKRNIVSEDTGKNTQAG